MSPDILIGRELGQGVMQRLLGQGTMGMVYLAYQAHLQRQVAIKIFLPASRLAQAEQQAFQERLKQEIGRATALKHTNILAVLDHGEQNGLIYEIMPYVAGESLQGLLSRSGALPYDQILHYLEQLAAALDYAHKLSILHRDIKPSNILLGSQGSLLLADFGLAGLTREKNFANARQPVPGILNYIAPEYVLGQAADQRADLYSLGVVLYHMVTGQTPFQGGNLSETVMQHLQVAPAPPCTLRKDLPQAAEQVILRALAKDPKNRYARARELAIAFRLALESAQATPIQNKQTKALEALADLASGGATSRMRRLSAPKLTKTPVPEPPQTQISASNTPIPSTLTSQSPKRTGLLSFANHPTDISEQPATQNQMAWEPIPNGAAKWEGQLASNWQSQPTSNWESQPANKIEEIEAVPTEKVQSPTSLLAPPPTPLPNGDNTGMFKLTEAVKIVQVPIAGQPGRYMTSFLPAVSPESSTEQSKVVQLPIAGQPGRFMTGLLSTTPTESPAEQAAMPLLKRVNIKQISTRMKIVSLLLVLVVLIGSSALIWSAHNRSNPAGQQTQKPFVDVNATTTALATATTQANIILSDNLSQNIHDWPMGQQGNFAYAFKNGAYHITNNDPNQSAPALLPNQVINGPFTYSLTMEQIQGDETSVDNQFGMIFYASIQSSGGKQVAKFYAFEVLNTSGGEYQFWKYDSSQSGDSPWTKLWHQNLGKEFLQGSGSSHTNTVKVATDGKTFTFFVNNQKVGSLKESSFSSGKIGMLVNLDGAEVAFSNLLLTYS